MVVLESTVRRYGKALVERTTQAGGVDGERVCWTERMNMVGLYLHGVDCECETSTDSHVNRLLQVSGVEASPIPHKPFLVDIL